MGAVLHVSADVGKIHDRGKPEVDECLLAISDLVRDDALDTDRERGIVRGERVVIVEVPCLFGYRELLSEQEHGKQRIGLLDHL